MMPLFIKKNDFSTTEQTALSICIAHYISINLYNDINHIAQLYETTAERLTNVCLDTLGI